MKSQVVTAILERPTASDMIQKTRQQQRPKLCTVQFNQLVLSIPFELSSRPGTGGSARLDAATSWCEMLDSRIVQYIGKGMGFGFTDVGLWTLRLLESLGLCWGLEFQSPDSVNPKHLSFSIP